jgi:hypothetical protein
MLRLLSAIHSGLGGKAAEDALSTVPERYTELNCTIKDLESLLVARYGSISYGQRQKSVAHSWDLRAVLAQASGWCRHAGDTINPSNF